VTTPNPKTLNRIEGKPAVRPTMTLTISCDHPVADGARAAQFVRNLSNAADDPAKFLV
jgi:pyruvate/2-oxoglutarate dehydrogenase complex dihydrolipoamide acyltransferase (E2) component